MWTVNVSQGRQEKLFVEKGTKALSFSPVPVVRQRTLSIMIIGRWAAPLDLLLTTLEET